MEKTAKKKLWKWIAGILLAACILTAGIGIAVEKSRESASERFEAFIDTFFREEVTESTINLHYILAYPENYGITDYEVSLGDYSYESLEESGEEIRKLEKELSGINRSRLTRSQQLTYDILKDYVTTELSVEDLALYTEALGPSTGYQAQLPVILAEYTFRTEQDIEDYLTLVSQVDDVAEEIIGFEEEKAKAGLFMPDFAADAIIEQCKEFIADPEENYMIEVFDDKIGAFEGLFEEDRQKYRERNHAIITTEVVEGYETLIEGLEGLKGSGSNELGLCYYEDGKEYYQYLVRTGTGSDDSVRDLMIKTENFIDTFIYDMQMQILEDPDLYRKFMDYQFPITEPDEILQDLREKSKEDFPEPPQVNYRVKYVHPSMQEHLSPAFYLITPVDDIQNNVIYINQKNGEETDLYPTLAHEGYPGHLYQNIYTNACDLPLVRNLFSYPGYTEGWATYVEHEYSYQYAGMEEALAGLSAGNGAATLAMHAYVDMGIHYEGWGREEVSEYLSGFGAADPDTVDRLFELIVEEPGNYLSYFIGYMEFLSLRAEAEKQMGESFDIKEFHDFLLSMGPAPFYIIEDYMEDYFGRSVN